MSLPAQLDSKLTQSHIPSLDGLRAVAVFLVIIAHFGFVMVPGAHDVPAASGDAVLSAVGTRRHLNRVVSVAQQGQV